MSRRWLIVPVAALLAWAGAYMAAHPYADRFAIGTWPVPQGTPWTYQLLSGFIAALAVLSLLGAALGLWHHVNCHEPRCWRLGRHKVSGTPWCDRHHWHARPDRTELEILESIERLLTALAESRTEP